MTNNQRKRFFANKLHRDLFVLVTLAAVVPAAVATFSLYYLIFNITAEQMGFPDIIAYNLIPAAQKVVRILMIVLPVTLAMIIVFAYQATHRCVGPYDRILRELDECIAGKKRNHIKLRPKDQFIPLVDRINQLIDKLV